MLDEPLSSLDAPLRTALRLELKKLRSELGACVVYVTHDHLEAMSLADRIAVLHEGRIQQVGTPDEIYRAPANRLVASFFGSPPMNLLRARLVRCTQCGELIGQGFRVLAPDLRSLSGRLPASRVLELGLPAEDLRVADTPSEATPFSARVLGVEPLGRKRIVHLMLGDAAMRAVVRPDHPVQSAGEAWIGFTPSPENLVDADTGLFLR
jgi:multiple sugar transport system ATP-binding protein